jgi:hypothetical protein
MLQKVGTYPTNQPYPEFAGTVPPLKPAPKTMDHLQQFTVSFDGSLSRQKVQEGVAVKYFRNSFTIDNKIFTVASPDDLSGLDGAVQFVKKGEKHPDGTSTIAQDAFSLLKIESLQGLRNRVESVKLKREATALG